MTIFPNLSHTELGKKSFQIELVSRDEKEKSETDNANHAVKTLVCRLSVSALKRDEAKKVIIKIKRATYDWELYEATIIFC